MCTRRVKSGRSAKSMNPKNTKKSPIHENAHTKLTCDFGDGDLSRLGVAYLTHVYITTSIILTCIMASIKEMRPFDVKPY